MDKKPEIVFPGSFLSTAEESVPGQNVYENDQGDIFSECIGKTEFNEQSHETSVNKVSRTVKPLSVGADVVAVVTDVRDKMVMVELLDATKNGKPQRILNRFATVPIFEVSDDFVKSLKGMFRIGDIMKARVSKLMPYAIDLSTKGKQYGIIKAFDAKTREPLYLVGDQLKCLSTGESEKRKVSSEYLLK